MGPLFKYTGSKRHLAKQIVSYFPGKILTYRENFLGGGSVFFELLRSGKSVSKFELSDINENIISLMNVVVGDPKMLMDNYRENWVKFQENVDYYYEVRDKFNETKDHFLYYFLTRTSYNGGIRFNSKGEFNMPCHFGRPGIHPDKLDEIITYHHNLMRGLDINLSVSSYEGHFGKNGDIIYSDPPYGKTKKGQLYKNVIDMDKFKEWASNLNCDLFLNLGGTNSKYDDDVIPKEFYDEKIIMESGNSSFSRLKNLNSVVQEYFYIKRNKKKII